MSQATGRMITPKSSAVLSPVLAVSLTLFLAVLPVLFEPRFYYQDDTQTHSIGLWSYMGERLLAGQITFIDPALWTTGNGAVDGQHGNWSPIILLIGIWAALSSDLLMFSSALKIVLITVSSLGVYLLARTWVAPRWAVVAAVLVPLNGVTIFIDAPSWTILLMTAAVLPYFWWSLRRMRVISPVPAVVFGVLIAGLGFAQSVMAAAVIGLATLVEAMLRRHWHTAAMVASVCAATALYAGAVFLPALLTSPVTLRDRVGISNDESMSGSLDFLGLSQFPTAQPALLWGWGPIGGAPFAYLSWALVALAFVPWRQVLPRLRRMVSVWLTAGMTVLVMLGPSDLGPIRWQVRFFPLLALAVVLLLVVGLATAQRHGWVTNRSRLLIAAAIIGWGTFQAFSNAPSNRVRLLVGIGASAIALVILIMAFRRLGGRRAGVVAAFLAATALVTTAQHAAFPDTPMPDFGLQAERLSFEAVQAEAAPPTIVAGSLRSDVNGAEFNQELVLGNAWLLGPTGNVNLYSSIGRRGFSDVLCTDYLGQTCPEILERLFREDEISGLPLADLMGLNSIVVVDSGPGRVDRFEDGDPPPGWSAVSQGRYTQTWVRDTPLRCEGGIAWTSPGLRVTDVTSRDEHVDFHIADIPPGGGRIVLCRLAWPGYAADNGADLGTTMGSLLTIDVPAEAEGSVVSLDFRLPGLPGVATAVAAVFVVTIISLTVWTRRRRHGEPSITSARR